MRVVGSMIGVSVTSEVLRAPKGSEEYEEQTQEMFSAIIDI